MRIDLLLRPLLPPYQRLAHYWPSWAPSQHRSWWWGQQCLCWRLPKLLSASRLLTMFHQFAAIGCHTFSSSWGLEAQHVCWFSHFSLQSPPQFLFSFQGSPTRSWPIINSTLRQCFNETRPVFSSAYPQSPSTFESPLPLWQLCPAPPCPQRFSPGNSWSERELVMKVN